SQILSSVRLHSADYSPATLSRGPRRSNHLRQPRITQEIESILFQGSDGGCVGTLPYSVKNNIILLTVLSEIFLREINDVVCANRAQHVQFACSVHTGHFRPVILRELDRNGPDASACAVDQNFLSSLNVRFSQILQSVKSADGNSRGFLVSHVDCYCYDQAFLC